MTARFAGHALLFTLALAVAAAVPAADLIDENVLLGYFAALLLGAAGALMARAPVGLIVIWVGAGLGVLLQLNWQYTGHGGAVAELSDRIGFYAVSLAVASAAYLASRLLLSRRARPQGRVVSRQRLEL